VSWQLPDDLDDRRLEELFFSATFGRPSKHTRVLPNFAEVRHQLQAHKHLTVQLVWEEYRETQPDGYGHSRFCELYQRWSRNQDVALRQDYHAGEKLL
jgi:transposase